MATTHSELDALLVLTISCRPVFDIGLKLSRLEELSKCSPDQHSVQRAAEVRSCLSQVQPLHVFSSRDKKDHPDAKSRCFERMLLCRMEHVFDPQYPCQ